MAKKNAQSKIKPGKPEVDPSKYMQALMVEIQQTKGRLQKQMLGSIANIEETHTAMTACRVLMTFDEEIGKALESIKDALELYDEVLDMEDDPNED